ncbi:putative thioredoxin-2 [Flexivirga endophytica]|uniref:Thioredoxin n=1 Tax=Flexivirga endophytica TaxID=1849103 RepID=A0A916T0M7_9MICO|nr:thioredoxin [Flexivirga endophytica]GGB24659.1 putative thioredoxin-2 [Flexivirga endophytica]GHB63361.1 putative thioredoxin-2 [Flexivirga endophytica]
MATKTLTTDTFTQEVQSDGIVLVDFWADWCGPCKMFAPIFEDASEKHPDLTFGKVDTDAEPALGQALQITSIPTLMIFRDGIRVFAQAGALPGPELTSLIDQARKLPMDEIRAQIAEEEAKQTGAEPGEQQGEHPDRQ